MNKIKKLRTEKSLTQEELARVSDIKLSTLQKLEREDANLEKMQLDTAVKLAKGLGIKAEELISTKEGTLFGRTILQGLGIKI